MDSAILKHATGNDNAEISMSIQPFPYTYKEETSTNNIHGLRILTYIGIGSSFIPSLIT